MIRTVVGKYILYDKGAVVVQTDAGLGFRIFVAETSQLLNAREGDELTIYTHFHVKEDVMSLFGFADMDGLKLFEQLISVNGIGPKAGLSIMSLGTPNQIKQVIAGKDAPAIARAQGVGKKTAERVILELSDKVDVLPFDGEALSQETMVAMASKGERAEAIMALTTLGYTKKEAEAAISNVGDEGA